MREVKKINNMFDCLNLFGSNHPFKVNCSNNENDDCLTKSGYIAFDQMRELLFFLQREGLIKDFNEDSLDRYINSNY